MYKRQRWWWCKVDEDDVHCRWWIYVLYCVCTGGKCSRKWNIYTEGNRYN